MITLRDFILEAQNTSTEFITLQSGDDVLGGDFDKLFEKLNRFVQDNGYMFFIQGDAPGQEVLYWHESWDDLLRGAYLSRDPQYNSNKFHSVELDTNSNCLILKVSFRPYRKQKPTHELRVWILNKEISDYFHLDCGVVVSCRNASFRNPQTDKVIFDPTKLPPLCDAPFVKAWYYSRKGFTRAMTKRKYVVPASEILQAVS